MANAETSNYLNLQHDLGRHLRSLRTDCPPLETARMLLSYDGPDQQLVGVRYDGERAIYFRASSRDAIAVFFDTNGLDIRGGRPIATVSHKLSLIEWVTKWRHYWAWRHPQVTQ